MSKIINKIDDELINSIGCDEINIYCSTEDDAKELLNQLYFIGYKWSDDTPIDETYFNNSDYDGIIYNICKCNNTITYWGSNHNYDFEFKLEKNNNSNNIKEVFEFNWEDFEDGKLLIKVNNYKEQVKCVDFITKHYNVDIECINYSNYEEEWSYIAYCSCMNDKWSRINIYDLGKNKSYINFKNIKQEENKDFDWEGFKNNKVDVILRSDEEAKDFFTKMYNEFNINECADYYKNTIMFDENNSEFKIYYNKYIDYWCVDSHDKCFINWSDYMDKENTTQILKNTLGEPHVEKVVDTSIYKRIQNTKQDIKQAFADIDTSVLYKIRELFDIIRHEKDIEKIKNILNIIDRLVITKNNVLNDFDVYMIDELNKEG